MKKQTVTLIPGDGIGPEIIEAVKAIFDAAKVPVEWEEENAGQATYEATGELIPQALIRSVEKNKIALKGPITTPVGKGFKSVNVQLRQKFDLHSNIRPCKTLPGVKTRYDNVDLVTFRENTEGLYAGLEYFDARLGIADVVGRVTVRGCERIIKSAFEYARQNHRKKVTLVHKANIIKKAGKVLLDAGQKIHKDYPEIDMDDIIVDNCCMQLVSKPEQFDILVTTNLFGDILSDLCAGLIGGLGVVAGANIGDEIGIFEAVHGSAPDIAGKNLANPTALLGSAIMMLRHMHLEEYADCINNALMATLQVKDHCTKDLGGKASTGEFAQKIIENLSEVPALN